MLFKSGHWRWLLSQSVVCLTCRHVLDTAPEHCPSCNQATFVQFNGKEDPNSLCEELLFVAALVRMGFDQSELSRSAVPSSVKNGKTARVGASAGQSDRNYRIAESTDLPTCRQEPSRNPALIVAAETPYFPSNSLANAGASYNLRSA